MGNYGNSGNSGSTERTIKIGDGDLKVTFDGNSFALAPEERKLIEDLLLRIEQHAVSVAKVAKGVEIPR